MNSNKPQKYSQELLQIDTALSENETQDVSGVATSNKPFLYKITKHNC